MIVSRCIGICDSAAVEVRRERDLIALGEANNSVEFFSELGILPGKDMEQLMADEFLEILLAFAELTLRKHNRGRPRVGRIPFFRSRRLDQLNRREQGES